MKAAKPSRALAAALATGLTVALPQAALAADPAPDRFTHSVPVDLPITFAFGSVWLASQLSQAALTSAECRWCDRASDGTDTLNALDKGSRDALRWSNPLAANLMSDVLGWGVSPVVAIGGGALVAGLDGRLDEAPANLLILLEASFASAALSQLMKFAVARERPFVHYLPAAEKKRTAKPADNNVSFYSAHANFAFAAAVSSGTIAYIRGYRGAPWLLGGGLAIATTIGYLRVAADRHYMTDVLVGAAMGSLAGFAIPYFFHRKSDAETTGMAPSAITATSNNISIAWTF
jgi:membrane-associated phospholipid phosphatase